MVGTTFVIVSTQTLSIFRTFRMSLAAFNYFQSFFQCSGVFSNLSRASTPSLHLLTAISIFDNWRRPPISSRFAMPSNVDFTTSAKHANYELRKNKLNDVRQNRVHDSFYMFIKRRKLYIVTNFNEIRCHGEARI